jgi:hypothetical protein|tara:strand:- start:2530 stop:2976 length:447 start_codon:yes stop_codon:yes gene_type:complete
MERRVMTWGFIPEDNKIETIYCGDAETSETKELNFEIIEDSCNGIDNDFKFKFDFRELWDSESSFYETISSYISTYLDMSISPSQIYGAYVLVNDEPDNFSSSFEIIDSEAGVFMNSNQEHNGKIFLRYYFEEDEEIYEEIVCVCTVD